MKRCRFLSDVARQIRDEDIRVVLTIAVMLNKWRAVQNDPEKVAFYADNPVNEADLTARHIWLVNQGKELVDRCFGDPDFCDPKIAGWWVWGVACWIGSGWCSGMGCWTSVEGRIGRKDAGRGVNRKRPHLGDAGRGVNRPKTDLEEYMYALAWRLRRVRVCCGDWARVVTKGALDCGSNVGVFLDPPYSVSRRSEVYNTDKEHGDVAVDVLRWCLENGDNPRYRVCLCGYEGEHEVLLEKGWTIVKYTANRSYGTSRGASDNSVNREKEMLFFSPACMAEDGVLEKGTGLQDKEVEVFDPVDTLFS